MFWLGCHGNKAEGEAECSSCSQWKGQCEQSGGWSCAKRMYTEAGGLSVAQPKWEDEFSEAP